MKTKVDNKEVVHLWAHKAQPSARGSHFYFEGDTIYSYGNHFPIARHYKGAVLFTITGYSSSTARHISITRQAIPPGVPVFEVCDVMAKPSVASVRALEMRAAVAVAKSRRATSMRSLWLGDAGELITKAGQLAAHFKLKCKVKTMDDLGVVADAIDQARKQETETRRKAAIKAEKAAGEAIEAWKRGESVELPWGLQNAFARIQGDELVTSKGARVPLDHIRRAGPVIRNLIDSGKPWHSNGHTIKLGHYAVDRIEACGTVFAGCHKFAKDEVFRVLALPEVAV